MKMNHRIKFLMLAIGTVFLSAAAEVPAPQTVALEKQPKPLYRKDQFIVKMKTPSVATIKTMGLEKAHTSALEKTARDTNLTLKSTFQVGEASSAPLAVMAINEATETVEAAIARLQSNPDVELAQPDFIYRASAVPNDTQYGKLWALKNTAQTFAREHISQSLYATANPGTAARDIGAETAWDKITDCSSVIVAVADTGINMLHDDLKDNLWSNMANEHGYDYVNNDADPSDDQGHGTHVAGTIGARGNNSFGTTGVCWRVKLMAVKVLGADGSGSTSAIAQGLNYAVTNGAHIINMSLGGSGYDSVFLNAVNAAGAAGVLVVAAAGNDGSSNNSYPTYPCNFPTANLVCVGAVDQSFGLASFSNYSTTYVDVGAPGTNILSTGRTSWTNSNLPLLAGNWTIPATTPSFAFTMSDFLQYPQNYDGTTAMYAANADNTAYTSFSMGSNLGAVALIRLRGAAQANADYLDIYNRGAAGSPFLTEDNLLGGISRDYPALTYVTIGLDFCENVSTCTLGLRFTSDATTQNFGYQITQIAIDYKVPSTTGLDGYNGTSMATPHVAGLAALVKAYNPAFTATDLKNAVVNTGTVMPALASRFSKSSVINAPNALKYVDPPTGVTLTIAP